MVHGVTRAPTTVFHTSLSCGKTGLVWGHCNKRELCKKIEANSLKIRAELTEHGLPSIELFENVLPLQSSSDSFPRSELMGSHLFLPKADAFKNCLGRSHGHGDSGKSVHCAAQFGFESPLPHLPAMGTWASELTPQFPHLLTRSNPPHLSSQDGQG